MSLTNNLADKARFLRNAAPQQYADFFGAFAEYAEAANETLVMTSVETLQLAQGHAQQCKKIMRILEEVKNNG
jgi:hypothetical protein